MTDFRKLMSIINEAQVERGNAPPKYDPADEIHYEASRRTGYFGSQGAGALLLAKTTGRILLLHRSEGVHEGNTWAGCGGAFNPAKGETPVSKTRQEIREETGYVNRVPLIPLPFIFRDGEFRYYNFLGLVDDEFNPELGWEATDSKWCDYGHWPNPLHSGIRALFSDQPSTDIIKHYVSLYQYGDEHPGEIPEIDESVVVTPNIANAMATQAATQAASANAQGPLATTQTQQGGQATGTPDTSGASNGSTPSPVQAGGTSTGTGTNDNGNQQQTTPKSLAPITSQ